MAEKTTNTEYKKMYTVRCTECGQVIENKFFSLKNILDCYYYGEAIEDRREKVIAMLGVGALYGESVLPKVPPLMEVVEEEVREDYSASGDASRRYVFTDFKPENISWYCNELKTFCSEDNTIPDGVLQGIELNIASVVAQFCLMTGFVQIYDMLRLVHKKMELENRMLTLSTEETIQLERLCNEFAAEPFVSLPVMATSDSRRDYICTVLSYIVEFAQREADIPSVRHFATEKIYIGWRYKVINDRAMPYMLAAKGSTGRIYHVTRSGCDKCHGIQACEVGAYRQKVVGILGTQSTGKTTYLTALSDAIDMGELSFAVEQNGQTRFSGISVQHSLVDDPQWARVNRAPGGVRIAAGDGMEAEGAQEIAGEAGPVWLYKHGYPPRKTDMKKLEAPALSFLIAAKDMEPVMYTLADIPGEAFSNAVEAEFDPLLVRQQNALLYACDALIMVISNRQLPESSGQEAAANMNTSASEILQCYASFKPNRPIPTAVVLTAADEINNGNLRSAMQIAFDPRNLPVMVWSEQRKRLVYNAEMMKTADTAVKNYINRKFSAFIVALQEFLQDRGAGGNAVVSAFAVSNGTQCAPLYFDQTLAEDYRSHTQENARCTAMRRERFGVTAPILWMLACDGLLPVGRGSNAYNDYDKDTQVSILKHLKKGLYR